MPTGAIVNKEKILIIAIAFLAGVGTLLAAIIIFEIDLVKWANCSAPFASPTDKQSAICRR